MLALYLNWVNEHLHIVLGSGSYARKELLDILRLKFEVVPSNYPEDLPFAPGDSPEAHVAEIAKHKLEDVIEQLKARKQPADIVITGDALIFFEGRVIGKPKDPAEAEALLRQLVGKKHTAHSAVWVALLNPQGQIVEAVHTVSSSEVTFSALSEDEIRAYVATGEPLGKSGSYALQEHGATLCSNLNGCFFGVWGFPLGAFVQLFVSLLKRHHILKP